MKKTTRAAALASALAMLVLPALPASAGSTAGSSAVGSALTVGNSVETSSATTTPHAQSSRAPVSAAAISGAPVSAWTAGGLITATGPATFAASGSGVGQYGGCTFYASSSSAGAYCAAGNGVTGPAQSLRAWLGGKPFYQCKFTPVPDGMYLNVPPRPNGTWMLKVCFQDYDLSLPWGGADTSVELFAQFVKSGERLDQPPYTLPGYMEQFWNYQTSRNFYPVPRISVGPKSYALVNAYTYFWTTWWDAIDSTKPAKSDYTVPVNTLTAGAVILHVRISEVTIHPGWPDMADINCGAADVPFDPHARDYVPRAEGGDQPSDCYTLYEHSSAPRDLQTVQIRATTDWHVTVEDGSGATIIDLGHFGYQAEQRLGVAEVQTLTGYDSGN